MSALYLGLMSGTSMDGVDAALCEFGGTRLVELKATYSAPYPPDLRARLLRLQREEPAIQLKDLAELDVAVAHTFAATAKALLAQTQVASLQVAAIGSHGQTVFHDPRRTGSSVQLGDANRIAVLTGISVVADFRRKDIALGGEGAPLVPAFHQAIFAVPHEDRCVVNIGGIGNITLLPASGELVRGFDTGPGNGLMDEWIAQHQGDAYDRGGEWAASGSLNRELLASLLGDPYFAMAPPKSTGRGDFNLDWVRRRYDKLDQLPAADVQRTFCELTAASICNALNMQAPTTGRLLVCGGGARNDFLMHRLAAISGLPVETTSDYGMDGDWVEAAAFAWLAMRTINKLPGNLPSVTGASRPAILGGIYRA